jgi:hypothetical protein
METKINSKMTDKVYPEDIAGLAVWLLTRRPNVKIGTPILI